LYWFEEPALTAAHWRDPAYLVGGKTIVGALIGGLFAVEIAKRLLGITRRTGDLFAVPLCAGIAIGRIGCFLTGLDDHTSGVVTSLAWGVNFGDGIARHPTQLYEVLFALALGGFLWRRMQRPFDSGDLFKMFMVAYFGFRLLCDFLKPEVRVLFGLSSIQWACLAMLCYYSSDWTRWLKPSEQRTTRTLTSEKMLVQFTKETQDPERSEAQGNAKFNERDRNGTAASIVYTSLDDTVRLRGGEPTVWDARARSKGLEMDSDLTHDISYSRGKTATTYYSQEKTNGATPFSNVKSPVYISSDRGEFHHDTGVAVYSGDARAWQDDNFVRADQIILYREQKQMEGRGHVQSALYQAKQKTGNATAVIPVLATADYMK